ncbi:Oxidoreductase short-chain dehydrogenase/reductase family [Penicillium angulare]|uniref:Oxidoreductase short-chain dehydrogenase/reductase family n=1 Tax=Penicillium angulare TaxID=116970 RepID=A0A9W9FCA2_9EURO|nr:Oxidoreductase short-chain dehydrogenase/reductase family [Penicillium angulare]
MTEHVRCDTQGAQVAEMFPDQVKNKTCLIRGGLAATTGDNLAHGGAATIIFTGRSQPEGQAVIGHITRKHPKTKMIFILADTNSLSSVYEAAKAIKALDVAIDGFIGFPSAMAAPWEITLDGIESHFQRNYLCFFLLVTQLVGSFAPSSRVVSMTTSIRRDAPAPTWDDVNFSNGEKYHPLDAYTQSAFANILFAKSLAQAYPSHAAFSANPGSEYIMSYRSIAVFSILINTDTKTNFQTYVSSDEVCEWLQRKKDEGQELPILLQQAPKSLAQASATVLRGLLDPTLSGK